MRKDFESTWEVTILDRTYKITTTNYNKARSEAAKLYVKEKGLDLPITDIAIGARAVKISSLEIPTTRKTTYLVKRYLQEKFQSPFQAEVSLESRQKVDLLGSNKSTLIMAEVKSTVNGALQGPAQLISYKEQIADSQKQIKLFLAIPNGLIEGLEDRGYYTGLLQTLALLGITLMVVNLKTGGIEIML